MFFDLGMSMDDVIRTLGNYDGVLTIDQETTEYSYFYKEFNGILFKFIHFQTDIEGKIKWIDFIYNSEDTKKDQREQVEIFKYF